jgi:hypothetical protein
VRFRLWKKRWLPYRTAEFLGVEEDGITMILGPWKWHRPGVWRNRWPK